MMLTNEKIAEMAEWTLEDFQDDPLGAMGKVRELAHDYLALWRERDAAIRDLEALMGENLSAEPFRSCKFCHYDGSTKCPLSWEGECRPRWRGPEEAAK